MFENESRPFPSVASHSRAATRLPAGAGNAETCSTSTLRRVRSWPLPQWQRLSVTGTILGPPVVSWPKAQSSSVITKDLGRGTAFPVVICGPPTSKQPALSSNCAWPSRPLGRSDRHHSRPGRRLRNIRTSGVNATIAQVATAESVFSLSSVANVAYLAPNVHVPPRAGNRASDTPSASLPAGSRAHPLQFVTFMKKSTEIRSAIHLVVLHTLRCSGHDVHILIENSSSDAMTVSSWLPLKMAIHRSASLSSYPRR